MEKLAMTYVVYKLVHVNKINRPKRNLSAPVLAAQAGLLSSAYSERSRVPSRTSLESTGRHSPKDAKTAKGQAGTSGSNPRLSTCSGGARNSKQLSASSMTVYKKGAVPEDEENDEQRRKMRVCASSGDGFRSRASSGGRSAMHSRTSSGSFRSRTASDNYREGEHSASYFTGGAGPGSAADYGRERSSSGKSSNRDNVSASSYVETVVPVPTKAQLEQRRRSLTEALEEEGCIESDNPDNQEKDYEHDDEAEKPSQEAVVEQDDHRGQYYANGSYHDFPSKPTQPNYLNVNAGVQPKRWSLASWRRKKCEQRLQAIDYEEQRQQQEKQYETQNPQNRRASATRRASQWLVNLLHLPPKHADFEEETSGETIPENESFRKGSKVVATAPTPRRQAPRSDDDSKRRMSLSPRSSHYVKKENVNDPSRVSHERGEDKGGGKPNRKWSQLSPRSSNRYEIENRDRIAQLEQERQEKARAKQAWKVSKLSPKGSRDTKHHSRGVVDEEGETGSRPSSAERPKEKSRKTSRSWLPLSPRQSRDTRKTPQENAYGSPEEEPQSPIVKTGRRWSKLSPKTSKEIPRDEARRKESESGSKKTPSPRKFSKLSPRTSRIEEEATEIIEKPRRKWSNLSPKSSKQTSKKDPRVTSPDVYSEEETQKKHSTRKSIVRDEDNDDRRIPEEKPRRKWSKRSPKSSKDPPSPKKMQNQTIREKSSDRDENETSLEEKPRRKWSKLSPKSSKDPPSPKKIPAQPLRQKSSDRDENEKSQEDKPRRKWSKLSPKSSKDPPSPKRVPAQPVRQRSSDRDEVAVVSNRRKSEFSSQESKDSIQQGKGYKQQTKRDSSSSGSTGPKPARKWSRLSPRSSRQKAAEQDEEDAQEPQYSPKKSSPKSSEDSSRRKFSKLSPRSSAERGGDKSKLRTAENRKLSNWKEKLSPRSSREDKPPKKEERRKETKERNEKRSERSDDSAHRSRSATGASNRSHSSIENKDRDRHRDSPNESSGQRRKSRSTGRQAEEYSVRPGSSHRPADEESYSSHTGERRRSSRPAKYSPRTSDRSKSRADDEDDVRGKSSRRSEATSRKESIKSSKEAAKRETSASGSGRRLKHNKGETCRQDTNTDSLKGDITPLVSRSPTPTPRSSERGREVSSAETRKWSLLSPRSPRASRKHSTEIPPKTIEEDPALDVSAEASPKISVHHKKSWGIMWPKKSVGSRKASENSLDTLHSSRRSTIWSAFSSRKESTDSAMTQGSRRMSSSPGTGRQAISGESIEEEQDVPMAPRGGVGYRNKKAPVARTNSQLIASARREAITQVISRQVVDRYGTECDNEPYLPKERSSTGSSGAKQKRDRNEHDSPSTHSRHGKKIIEAEDGEGLDERDHHADRHAPVDSGELANRLRRLSTQWARRGSYVSASDEILEEEEEAETADEKQEEIGNEVSPAEDLTAEDSRLPLQKQHLERVSSTASSTGSIVSGRFTEQSRKAFNRSSLHKMSQRRRMEQKAATESYADDMGAGGSKEDTIGMLLQVSGSFRKKKKNQDLSVSPPVPGASQTSSPSPKLKHQGPSGSLPDEPVCEPEVLVTLAYSARAGHLSANVLRGRSFPPLIDLCEVHATLTFDGIHSVQKISEPIANPGVEPHFNKPFSFPLQHKFCNVASLLLQFWGKHRINGTYEIGDVEFGADGQPTGLWHWAKMQQRTGLPFPMWHKLLPPITDYD